MHPRGARTPELVPCSRKVLATGVQARRGHRAHELPRVCIDVHRLGSSSDLHAQVLSRSELLVTPCDRLSSII